MKKNHQWNIRFFVRIIKQYNLAAITKAIQNKLLVKSNKETSAKLSFKNLSVILTNIVIRNI